MPRFKINDELSFRYPDACDVQPRFKGRGFRLDFPDADPDSEAYYVKWIQTKTPQLVWEWLASSPFDKAKDLEPVERDLKVAGFRLRPLPNLYELRLGHGEYASFRGSEYAKSYDGTEWIEITWARLYARTVEGKLRVMGMGFTASGNADIVAPRLRSQLLNLHSGFRFTPPDIREWHRVKFPREHRTEPAAAPRPRTRSQSATPGSSAVSRPSTTTRSAGPVVMPTRQCGACSGTGTQVCGACNGSGGRYDSYTTYDWEGNPQYEQQWLSCFCSGGYSSCGACAGKGWVYA